jgi:hypothetical protein
MAVIQVQNSPQGTYNITTYRLFAQTITPSDVDTFSSPVTVFVGGAGTVAVECGLGGNVVNFTMTAGAIIPLRVTRVLATGTTATLMIGMS